MDVIMEIDETQQNDCDAQRKKRKRRCPDEASSDEVGSAETTQQPDVNGAPAAKYREVENEFQLEDFSDEVLFEIFKNLDSWGLLALMNCCQRFHGLILDRRFWNEIDQSREPLPLGLLEDLLERTHVHTHSIKLRGPSPSQHVQGEIQQYSKTLSATLTQRCTHLRVLEMQGVTLDFQHIRILDFPKTLRRLLFNDCNVHIPDCVKSIFSGIDTHLTELEELGIENSDWFEPHFMMMFSKAPALRWLSLQGCKQLVEFVPYGSMAARFGFKRLEYLDMRFTPITDSDLQCFNAVLTLKEIRLDCPEPMRNLDEKETIQLGEQETPNGECAPSTSTASLAARSVPTGGTETPSTSAGPEAPAPQWNVTISLSLPNNGGRAIAVSPAAVLAAGAQRQANEQVQQSQANEQVQQRQANEQVQQRQANEQVQQPSEQSAPSQPPGTSAVRIEPPALVISSTPTETSPSTSSTTSSSTSSSSPPALSSPSATGVASRAVASPPPPARIAPAVEVLASFGRNAPPRSRFLPRPEQVIMLDFHNRERSFVMHGAPRRLPNYNNANNHLDQVLNHPLFWDIINPLPQGDYDVARVAHGNDLLAAVAGVDDGNADGGAGGNGGRHRHSRCFFYNRRHSRQRCPISDRGICCFGRPRNPVDPGVIWIRIGNRPSENSFRRLTVRNYKMVTDISLQHLMQCSPSLGFLDVSGTNVTLEGVQTFKQNKPECQVIADHLIMPTTPPQPPPPPSPAVEVAV